MWAAGGALRSAICLFSLSAVAVADVKPGEMVCALSGPFCSCSKLSSYVTCLHKMCDDGQPLVDDEGHEITRDVDYTKLCQEALSVYGKTSCGTCDVKCSFSNCVEGKGASAVFLAILFWGCFFLFELAALWDWRCFCRHGHPPQTCC